MSPKVEPLTNVDAAWLGMEDPTNLMMVSGIMTFDEPIDIEHLKVVLTHRFLKTDNAPAFSRLAVRSPDPKTIFKYLALVKQAEAAAADDPARYQGMTKNGRRCRNRALAGSNYCRLHG